MLKISINNVHKILKNFNIRNTLKLHNLIILSIISVTLELFGISFLYIFLTKILNTKIIGVFSYFENIIKVSDLFLIIIGVSLVVLSNIFIIFNNLLIESYKKKFEVYYSKEVLKNFINNNPMFFYDKNFLINTTQLISNDLFIISSTLITSFLNLISRSIIIISLLFFSIFFLNFDLILSFLIIILFSCLIYFLFIQKLRKSGTESFKKISYLFGVIKDLLNGSAIFNLFSNHNSLSKYIGTIAETISRGRFLSNIYSSSLKYLVEIMMMIFFLIVILFTKLNFITEIIAIIMISLRLLPHLTNVNISIGHLNSYYSYGENFLKYFDNHKRYYSLQSEFNKNSFPDSLNKISLNLDQINFNKEDSLKFDNKLIFYSGKKYIINGINGSGKSSFLNAISYNTNFVGEITINDVYVIPSDIFNINIYRSKYVSFVSQHDYFIHGSVKENLYCFNENDIDKNKLNYYLNYFKFSHYVEKDINELSGGNLKILSIIRSLIFDRSIFIFDEPFNNLDKDNIKLFKDLLNSNMFNDKIIIVTDHGNNLDYDNFNIINI